MYTVNCCTQIFIGMQYYCVECNITMWNAILLCGMQYYCVVPSDVDRWGDVHLIGSLLQVPWFLQHLTQGSWPHTMTQNGLFHFCYQFRRQTADRQEQCHLHT